MIKKLVRQMLTAQILSALTVSLCLLIDNIMIARFLGADAIAAYGLASPLLLSTGAIGTLLSAGVQVACSRSLGKGSMDETNSGYSSSLVLGGGIAVVFMTAVVLFAPFFAGVMGAGSSGELFEQTRDYLVGYSIGAPGSIAALVLIPFMQMAGRSGLLIAAVLTMTVTDVALDLLNVLVFNGGMFGMGLASSLSYYAAVIVAGIYFVSSKCVFRFSRRLVHRKKFSELLRSGVPAGFNMLASMILVFVLNRILKAAGGADPVTPVAAYTVITGIGNAANCITTGVGGVSLTLGGIFYNEEDKTGLRATVRHLCRYGALLGAAMGVFLLFAAPLLISLFIAEEGAAKDLAVLGLRCFAAGLIPCALNNALKFMYQATEQVPRMVFITFVEGTIFPVLAAFVFSRFMGVPGVWLYFPLGELLALVCVLLIIWRKSGKPFWKDGAYLLLKPDFGVRPEDLLELDIHSLEEVSAAAQQAEAFCLSHGQDSRTANHIALCVEEMAANTVEHGFSRDRKKHHLALRVLKKPNSWILRFRDDCRAFDPVHYVPGDDSQALGLRLVRAMSEDAQYTYSLNLNNLMLKLPVE